MIVPDLLRRAAAEAGDRLALIVDGGGEITYAQWEARSNAAARGLVARGISPGDRVALHFENTDWIAYGIAYFATLKAGAVAVPLSSRFVQPEIEHILAHSGARATIGALDVPVLEEDNDASTFQVPRTDDDLADIIYTSGTTGTPKGVASPHGNVAFEHIPGGTPWIGQTFVHAIPLATFAGTYAMMVVPVSSRMTTVALPRFDPGRFCAQIEARRATIAYMVPAMARLLVDSGAARRRDVSSLKVLRFGTAPISADLLASLHETFPGAILINVYGLTEAGPAGTMMVYDPARPGSLGRPVGATRLRVTRQDGGECAPGETGEIWIGRPPGMPGRRYFGEEATGVFRDEWVRTGDLGYVAEDGSLYLVDRAKDMVIRGGYNISSVEVESVLLKHPAVADAAVVGVPHEVLGEDVAAVIVTRSSVTSEELQEYCRKHLADYKVPRRIEFSDALPRNLLGKILKRELRARLAGARV